MRPKLRQAGEITENPYSCIEKHYRQINLLIGNRDTNTGFSRLIIR